MKSQKPSDDSEVPGQLDLLNELPDETRGSLPSQGEDDTKQDDQRTRG